MKPHIRKPEEADTRKENELAEGLKLYELDALYRNFEFKCDPETGEILNLDEFEQIEANRRTKLEHLGIVIKILDAEIEALKNEKKGIDDRIRVKQNKRDRLAEYLKKLLAGEKFETPRVLVNFNQSEQTVILQEDRIPDQFVKCEVVRKPIKAEIKKYIKSLGEGAIVPWAKIETKINMTVK